MQHPVRPGRSRSETPILRQAEGGKGSPVSDFEAIGLALAGFTLWVLADSTIKLIGKSTLPAYEVIAFLGLFIVTCLAAYAAIRGEIKPFAHGTAGRQKIFLHAAG